jgi:hypothetical protein
VLGRKDGATIPSAKASLVRREPVSVTERYRCSMILLDRYTFRLSRPSSGLFRLSPAGVQDPTQNRFTLDLFALEKAGYIVRHPAQDVVVVRFLKIPDGKTIFPFPGVTVNQTSKSGVLGVSSESVRTFDQILTGNDVMIFGYPSSIGLQDSPQIDYLRPLLRKGIVAGTNPSKPSIILDCPSYFGNSGGPVLEIDRQALGAKFAIIGVVIEYIPFNETAGSQTVEFLTNSGYSVAAPMDFVLELVKTDKR